MYIQKYLFKFKFKKINVSLINYIICTKNVYTKYLFKFKLINTLYIFILKIAVD